MTTTSINLNLLEKFKSKSFFHKFFVHRVADEISGKIRDLREKRELTQKEFAAEADMKQSAVSRLEQSDYGGWNFKTLARIAEVLDARLVVDFVPREDVIRQFEKDGKSNNVNEQKSVLEALREARGLETSLNGNIGQEVPNRLPIQRDSTSRGDPLSRTIRRPSESVWVHGRARDVGTNGSNNSNLARRPI